VILLAASPLVLAAARHSDPPTRHCRPIQIAAEHVTALNAFWNRRVILCASRAPRDNAVATPDEERVDADPRWLAVVARRYGAVALAGLLAHEWAHVVQGGAPGLAAEMQADCLAGAYLRRARVPGDALRGFERLAGDSGATGDGMASGRARIHAVRRGYHGPVGGRGRLIARCRW